MQLNALFPLTLALGRGKAFRPLGIGHRAVSIPRRGPRFSLSLRERVGVRGNVLSNEIVPA